MRLRSGLISDCDAWAISWPSNLTEPAVGAWMRATTRASVDFPQPDSPTSPTVSPFATSRSTPSTACTTRCLPKNVSFGSGKCFTTPRNCSIGWRGLLLRYRRCLHRGGRRLARRRRRQGLAVLRDPAARLAARQDLEQVRMLRAALDPERATRGKTAAGREIDRIGRRAIDGDETLLARNMPVDARHGVDQRPGVRDGADRRGSYRSAPPPRLRRHTSRSRASRHSR